MTIGPIRLEMETPADTATCGWAGVRRGELAVLCLSFVPLINILSTLLTSSPILLFLQIFFILRHNVHLIRQSSMTLIIPN